MIARPLLPASAMSCRFRERDAGSVPYERVPSDRAAAVHLLLPVSFQPIRFENFYVRGELEQLEVGDTRHLSQALSRASPAAAPWRTSRAASPLALEVNTRLGLVL